MSYGGGQRADSVATRWPQAATPQAESSREARAPNRRHALTQRATSVGMVAGGALTVVAATTLFGFSAAGSAVAGGGAAWLVGLAGSMAVATQRPAAHDEALRSASPSGRAPLVHPPGRPSRRPHHAPGPRAASPTGASVRRLPVPPARSSTPSHLQGPGATADAGGWSIFEQEIDRSRRYERPVTLVQLPQTRTSGRFNPDRVVPWMKARLQQLQPFIRTTDVAWFDHTSIYVMLPETNRESGEVFLRRLETELPNLLPQPEARIAAFPTDGLTVGGLFAALNDSPTRVRA